MHTRSVYTSADKIKMDLFFFFAEEVIHLVLDCISKHQLVGLEDVNLSSDEVMLLEFCCGQKSEATENLWETMQDYAAREGMCFPHP